VIWPLRGSPLQKNVLSIIRVSTKEQSQNDRTGLKRQESNLQLIYERHNLKNQKTYAVIDVSGTSVLKTPEYKELIQKLQSPDIDGVAVSEFDRLMRLDNFDQLSLLQRIAENHKFIYTHQEKIDLNTHNGFLSAAIQALVGGAELANTKFRITEAKEKKRIDGEHPTNKITLPMGVGYDRKTKHWFWNNDAPKVKRLFDMFYFQGIHNLCELSRLTGINNRTIANILRNATYIGKRIYSQKRGGERRTKPDGKQADRKKVDRDTPLVVDLRDHDPAFVSLIDKEVFDSVQAILSRSNKEYHAKRSSEGERFLYSGFLYCPCGQPMYSTSGGRNHKKDYYYCRSKNYNFAKYNGESNCASGYLQKEDVEHTVNAFMTERLTDKEYLLNLIKLRLDSDDFRRREMELESIMQELNSAKVKLDRIHDLYVAGEISSIEDLKERVKPFRAEISFLEDQLLLRKKASLKVSEAQVELFVESLTSSLSEFSFWSHIQKRSLLQTLMAKIQISKQGISGITLAFCEVGSHMGRGSWPPPA
jgi:DNA invertase Pin-like site-specific DNA recombinase